MKKKINFKLKPIWISFLGIFLGFLRFIYWRFLSRYIFNTDNFYYDFIFSWLTPLIVGLVIFYFDKNKLSIKISNLILFVLVAFIAYFVFAWFLFPVLYF